ncbi:MULTISPECIES: DUF2934 domain-containing protein [unclassified Pseudomonas]|uniref:DUF2934 domain-containing protein n=1 Tax=unclassified Pseudomonas TaxID=196821 RepID=UPI001A0679B0|nr:DUF2934 domain-containing protein [Pseudomonas sp.]MBF0674137.1 DUF2934 domain-containing protein [Pseudomonas sp.]
MSDEQRIRELAYQIWESEGKPAGQEDRHWAMASKLVQTESVPAGKPKLSSRRAGKPQATMVPPSSPEEKAAVVKEPRKPRQKPGATPL